MYNTYWYRYLKINLCIILYILYNKNLTYCKNKFIKQNILNNNL